MSNTIPPVTFTVGNSSYGVFNVRGDGDCFYHALSHVLARCKPGTDGDVQDLEAVLTNHFELTTTENQNYHQAKRQTRQRLRKVIAHHITTTYLANPTSCLIDLFKSRLNLLNIDTGNAGPVVVNQIKNTAEVMQFHQYPEDTDVLRHAIETYASKLVTGSDEAYDKTGYLWAEELEQCIIAHLLASYGFFLHIVLDRQDMSIPLVDDRKNILATGLTQIIDIVNGTNILDVTEIISTKKAFIEGFKQSDLNTKDIRVLMIYTTGLHFQYYVFDLKQWQLRENVPEPILTGNTAVYKPIVAFINELTGAIHGGGAPPYDIEYLCDKASRPSSFRVKPADLNPSDPQTLSAAVISSLCANDKANGKANSDAGGRGCHLVASADGGVTYKGQPLFAGDQVRALADACKREGAGTPPHLLVQYMVVVAAVACISEDIRKPDGGVPGQCKDLVSPFMNPANLMKAPTEVGIQYPNCLNVDVTDAQISVTLKDSGTKITVVFDDYNTTPKLVMSMILLNFMAHAFLMNMSEADIQKRWDALVRVARTDGATPKPPQPSQQNSVLPMSGTPAGSQQLPAARISNGQSPSAPNQSPRQVQLANGAPDQPPQHRSLLDAVLARVGGATST